MIRYRNLLCFHLSDTVFHCNVYYSRENLYIILFNIPHFLFSLSLLVFLYLMFYKSIFIRLIHIYFLLDFPLRGSRVIFNIMIIFSFTCGFFLFFNFLDFLVNTQQVSPPRVSSIFLFNLRTCTLLLRPWKLLDVYSVLGLFPFQSLLYTWTPPTSFIFIFLNESQYSLFLSIFRDIFNVCPVPL